MAEPKGRTSAFKEVGVTGLPQFGGVIAVETDPDLSGTMGYEKFLKMRRDDPTGAGMYAALTLPIRNVDWRVIPGGPTSSDEAAAEFTWTAFNDMSNTLADVISGLCTMFIYGWSYMDMTLKKRRGWRTKSKYEDGLTGFKKFGYRSPRRIDHWELEPGTTDIKGWWQTVYPDEVKGEESNMGLVYLSLHRGVLARTTVEDENPEGMSVFRPAYRPWTYLRRLEQIEGIGLYRRWAGFPIAYIPPDSTKDGETEEGVESDETKARKLVLGIYKDTQMGAYVPDTWNIKFGGPEGAVDKTMSDTVIRKQTEMARAILAQFLLTGMRQVGTQSLAETQLNFFYLAVESYLKSIASLFNRYSIPYLFRHNIWPGLTALPLMVPGEVREVDLESVGKFLSSVARVNLLTPDSATEDWVRSLVPGMPEASDPSVPGQKPTIKTGEDEKDEDEDEGRFAMGFAIPAGEARIKRYRDLADGHGETQRANLEDWATNLAAEVAAMPQTTTDQQLSDKLDDAVLLGLLLLREQSVLDIAAGFWLGFGKPAGGVEVTSALQSEIAMADEWYGWGGPGQLRRTNPIGKPSFFGDIAGQLEGKIGAILLLLKAGRREDAYTEVISSIGDATRGFSRADLYGGHVWRSTWRGALERGRWEEATLGIPIGQIRWVLDPFARHCSDCIEFGDDPPGRTYQSIDMMLSVTGGVLPGVGTECAGRCRCGLKRQRPDGVWEWWGYDE